MVDDPTPEYDYGIIVCALRFFVPEMSPYYADLFRSMPHQTPEEVFAVASRSLVATAVQLRDEEALPVVALDVAGAEAGFPAKPHVPAYEYAHSKFLGKTVHAGEAYVSALHRVSRASHACLSGTPAVSAHGVLAQVRPRVCEAGTHRLELPAHRARLQHVQRRRAYVT